MAKDIMQHAQGCDVHTGMNFGAALEAMRNGMAVRLPHWSPEVKILIQKPDENSKMTAPYLYVQSRSAQSRSRQPASPRRASP